MKTYEEFKEHINNTPPHKFGPIVIAWAPKNHWQYWIYTFLIRIVPKKYKQYWFTKRCNFIHKPFIEALGRLKAKPLDLSRYKESFDSTFFTWEVVNNNN